MGIGPVTLAQITVTTAGTRVQVSASKNSCVQVRFEAPAGNTGAGIYIGDSSVSATRYMAYIPKGTGITFSMLNHGASPNSNEYDLTKFYVDGAANGDKLNVGYFERLGS